MNFRTNPILIISLLFIPFLVSNCSQRTETSSGPVAPTGPARTLAEVPHPTMDPLGKYTPPITVKVIHTQNDGGFWFSSGESFDYNIYTRRYENQLGIKYEFLWTSPSSQGTERFNIMVSTGDLPDFFTVNKLQFEQLFEAGMLEDLTDPIIDYASDYLRRHLTGEYQDLLDTATRDGRYYGIGAGNAFIDAANVTWLRKDYMDALGLSVPTTIDELDAFMNAMKTRNPARLPASQTFPLALRGADQGPFDFIMGASFYWMFNSYPPLWSNPVWYKNSRGEIEHGMFGAESRTRTRAALEKAREFHQKGYISPSFATDTFDLMVEHIAQGRASVLFTDVWASWWPLNITLDNDANADWIPIGLPQAGAEPARMGGSRVQVSHILVARKGVRNPEALVKMSNLFLDLNDNPETMEFDAYNTDPVDGNGIFLAYPLIIHNPAFNVDALNDITEAQITGDSSNLCEAFKSFYDMAMDYAINGNINGWPSYRNYLKDDSSLAVANDYIKRNMVVYNEYTAEPTQFMVDNESTVKKLFDTMAVGVISGNLGMNEYDRFITQWDTIYGNTATREVNDWYRNK